MSNVKAAHMCRDGHVEIYHNDSEHELCPVCRCKAALGEALELATRSHYECDDCFYSCSTICCDDSRRDRECDCGADAINKRIAALRMEFLE